MKFFQYTSRAFRLLDHAGILSWSPLPYFAMLFGVLAAYSGALHAGFYFDDPSLFTNPLVTERSGVVHLFDLTQTRPLTYFTYWLNYQIWGKDAFAFHAVNLALHVLVVMLLYNVFKRLIGKGGAALAAGLFAIHPIQSEAIAYVFARGTLLCALFSVLTLHFWLKGRQWLAIVCFALALASKEESVTLPLLLALLLYFWPAAREWVPEQRRQRLVSICVMLGLALLAGMRAVLATKAVHGSGAGFEAGIAPWNYLAAQGMAMLRYLRLLIVPVGFTIDPDVRTSPWLYALAWAGVGAILLLATRRFKNLGYGFWIVAGFILLIPSSSIFPAADLAADRRMYLPMIGFAAAAGLLAQRWNVWIPRVIAVGLIYVSITRMAVWHNERDLWAEAVRQSPDKSRPLIQLARTAPPEEAVDLLTDAKRLAPNDYFVATELGTAWLRMNHAELALPEFGRALAMRPHNAEALNNRAATLLLLGQERAALQDFRDALKADPCLAAARMNVNRLGTIVEAPACPTAK